jgi:hypothetical protein
MAAQSRLPSADRRHTDHCDNTLRDGLVFLGLKFVSAGSVFIRAAMLMGTAVLALFDPGPPRFGAHAFLQKLKSAEYQDPSCRERLFGKSGAKLVIAGRPEAGNETTLTALHAAIQGPNCRCRVWRMNH